MKTGKIAQLLGGLNPQTVNAWASRPEIEPFLSDAARKIGVSQRDFDASDRVILNTVRELRQRDSHISWEEIGEQLTSGYRCTEWPASATTVDGIVPMEVMTSSALAIAERDRAIQRVAELEQELARMANERRQMEAEAAKRMEEAQHRWLEAEMERAGRLYEQIGRLKGLLKQNGIDFE